MERWNKIRNGNPKKRFKDKAMRNNICRTCFSALTKILMISVASLLFLTACEKAAHEQEWGFSLLYMPQAIVQSGGANNNFLVDLYRSASPDTMVVVGLYRSGLEPIKEVSVDVLVDADTLAYMIAAANEPDAPSGLAIFKSAILLDPAYYELPARLSLANGQRSSFEHIKIKKNALWDHPAPSGTPFILPVRIANPTRYELNEDLSITFFVFYRK